MKGLGETSPFHRFTNPQRDKSVYFLSWSSNLLYINDQSIAWTRLYETSLKVMRLRTTDLIMRYYMRV